MHDFEYQRRQVERGKRRGQYIDYVDRCLFAFLKHLIHVFVAIAVASFVYITWLLIAHDHDFDKYQVQGSRASSSIAVLLRYHPAYFGLTKLGQSAGVNVSASLQKLNIFRDAFTDIRDDRFVIIHPLYVELMQ